MVVVCLNMAHQSINALQLKSCVPKRERTHTQVADWSGLPSVEWSEMIIGESSIPRRRSGVSRIIAADSCRHRPAAAADADARWR